VWLPIHVELWHDLADGLVDDARSASEAGRLPVLDHRVVGRLLLEVSPDELDRLGSTEEFDCDDGLYVGQHVTERQGSASTHTDVVLLVAADGRGVRRVRTGGPALVEERCGGILGDHVPAHQPAVIGQKRLQVWLLEVRVEHAVDPAFGDGGQFRERVRPVVEPQGQWLPVEVPAGEHCA